MSSNTLSRLTPQQIINVIETEKDDSIHLMRIDNDFITRVYMYDITKVPYASDKERNIYEEILENNQEFSAENMTNQPYILNERRNQMIDNLFIGVMSKTIDNGIYDNIEDGLSDYVKYILYIDNMLHQLGHPTIIKDAITNMFINRASTLIKEYNKTLNLDNDYYDIYYELDDEKGSFGIDPISTKKISICFRLDADDRRICYDISTIVNLVNSTFGIDTPVSPFNRKPFSINDIRRIRGFIKILNTNRAITRSMSKISI